MTQRICSIDGCGQPHSCRGWCATHYSRWQTHRDPSVVKHQRESWSDFERLLAIETDECVIWPHSLSSQGYGQVTSNGILRGVHLWACELRHGCRPDASMEVAHRCGVRGCMNYRHLRWATRAENIADMLLHGTDRRGERHPLHKLTVDDVREIRDLRTSTSLTYAQIAERYGVSLGTVRSVVLRKSWAWLDQAS